MSSKFHEDKCYGLDLDLPIILHYLLVSYPRRNGCRAKSVHFRPAYLLHVLSCIDHGRKHSFEVPFPYSVSLDPNEQNSRLKIMLNGVDGKNFFPLRFNTNRELIIVC